MATTSYGCEDLLLEHLDDFISLARGLILLLVVLLVLIHQATLFVSDHLASARETCRGILLLIKRVDRRGSHRSPDDLRTTTRLIGVTILDCSQAYSHLCCFGIAA